MNGSAGTSKPPYQPRPDDQALQFRDAIFDESQSDSAIDEGLGLIRTYFHVLASMKPVNRARLVLWADAVATDSPDVRPAMIAADREFRERSEKPVLHLYPRSGSGLGRRRSDSGDRVVTVGIYPLVSNVLNTFGVPAAREGIMS